MESDILLLDKPKGITSFDVILKLRKKLEIKKIGHAGTLDPLASGLLLIGVGKGTKKLANLVKLRKTYEVKVRLGESRTTGDMEGEIIEKKEVTQCGEEKIEKVLSEMVGRHDLPVPRYSAIKVDGQPLYKKARRGEDFEPPKRIMEISAINLLNFYRSGHFRILDVVMEVSSGSYIRSLVIELGKRLGYPAVVEELRRTKIGEFDIKDAKTLKSIEN